MQTEPTTAPALEADSPPRARVSLLPAFSLAAFACGVVASGDVFAAGPHLLALATAAALVVCWGVVWQVCDARTWAAPLAQWRAWPSGAHGPRFPYAQPDTAAARASLSLGRLNEFARRALMPGYGATMVAGVCAAIVALLLALSVEIETATTLTFAAMLLSPLPLALMLFTSNAATRQWRTAAAAVEALVCVAFPMALGRAAFAPLTAPFIACALLVGLAYVSADNWLFNAGYGAVMLLLLSQRFTLGAFVFALLWLPQFLIQALPRTPQRARTSRAWLAASMLAACAAFA